MGKNDVLHSINLGDIVKDLYTGFTGVYNNRTEWMYGCNRIGITPIELKDGQPQKTQEFDEQRVVWVKDGFLRTSTIGLATTIQLGSEAKDKLTGFKGFVTAKVIYLHGPGEIALESKKLKDGVPANPLNFVEDRIELIQKKEPIVANPPKSGKKMPGGPQREFQHTAGTRP